MKVRHSIRLDIVCDSLYAPPERWEWDKILELEEGDTVKVTRLSPIPIGVDKTATIR